MKPLVQQSVISNDTDNTDYDDLIEMRRPQYEKIFTMILLQELKIIVNKQTPLH